MMNNSVTDPTPSVQLEKKKFDTLPKSVLSYLIEFLSLNDLLILNYTSKRFKGLFSESQVKLFKAFANSIKGKQQDVTKLHKYIQNELTKIIALKSVHSFTEYETYQLIENFFTYCLVNRLEDSYRLSFDFLNNLKEYYINYFFKYLTSSQCQLTLLNLACNNMVHGNFEKSLSEGLALNKSVKLLEMSYMKLEYPEALKIMAEGLKQNKGITKFIMIGTTGNNNGTYYLDAILKALTKNTAIREAFICDNRRSEPIIGKSVGELLQVNTTLRVLSFAGNFLYDEGVNFICKGLISNTTLKNLYLANNKMSGEGIRDLCNVLKVNNTLEHLDIADNQIISNPDFYFKLLGEVLETNTGLKYLHMKNCDLNDNAVALISKGLLSNSTLTNLILYDNIGITNNSVPVIVDLLNTNKTLIEVDLLFTSISEDNLEVIAKLLDRK